VIDMTYRIICAYDPGSATALTNYRAEHGGRVIARNGRPEQFADKLTTALTQNAKGERVDVHFCDDFPEDARETVEERVMGHNFFFAPKSD